MPCVYTKPGYIYETGHTRSVKLCYKMTWLLLGHCIKLLFL